MRNAAQVKALVSRFNVRVMHGERHYVRVYIFNSREAMYLFWKLQLETGRFGKASKRARRMDFQAQASTWLTLTVPPRGSGRRPTLGNCVGQVLFHIDRIGGGIVTHEMTHIGLGYLDLVRGYRRQKWDPVKNDAHEELLCRVVGDCTRRFWNAFWARKLDRKSPRAPRRCS